MVVPKAKLAGSTSVRCWLLELVKESQLNSISGTLAGTNFEPAVQEPEAILFWVGFGLAPQPDPMIMHVPNRNTAIPRTVDFNGLPFSIPPSPPKPFHTDQGHLGVLGTKYREAQNWSMRKVRDWLGC